MPLGVNELHYYQIVRALYLTGLCYKLEENKGFDSYTKKEVKGKKIPATSVILFSDFQGP
jgi:hypothetical protein